MDLGPYALHAVFLLVYLLVLIGVGAWKAGRIASQEDFSLAGRGLSTFVLVGTLLATWIGTGSIFGNAQKTYAMGLGALLLPIGGVAGILALSLLARRIRTFGQFTIQDILEARFGIAARVLATLALVAAYVVIVSYQYRAGGALLERVTPALDPTAARIAVAAFVVLYTALAGMFSVAYTDVANGILMSLGALLAIPVLVAEAGGWASAIEALEPLQREVLGGWTGLHLVGATLPPFLLVLGDANMYQRFFSARDARSARRSAVGMLAGVLVLEVAIILIALLATALVAQGRLDAPSNPAYIIIAAAFDVLPPALGALLVATAAAIVVSTADSYLLSPATSLVRDVYQRFLDPGASPRRLVFVGRGFVVLLGALSLGLAFLSEEFFGVALFAYTIYGCAITPAIVAAFFWRRASYAGAVASIVTGAGVALVWEGVPWLHAARDVAWAGRLADALRMGDASAVIVAFPLSVAALVVVSLVTAPPTREQTSAI